MEMVMIIGAVAITGLVAWTVASSNMGDAIAIGASSLPGSHPGDNGPMTSAQFMEITLDGDNVLKLDGDAIESNIGTQRFGDAMGDDTGNLSDSVVPGPGIRE
jgi:hypothetical protein